MHILNRNLIIKAVVPAILAIALSMTLTEGAQAGGRNTVGIAVDLGCINLSYMSSIDNHHRPVLVVPSPSHGPRYHYVPAPAPKGHPGHFRAAPKRSHSPKFAHNGPRPGQRR